MFGGIMAAIFGGLFTREWCKGVQDEQKDRQQAKQYGNKLYVDKYGHYRHTDTGKKYTSKDGKKAYKEYCIKQEGKREQWDEVYDEIEKEYISYYNDYIKEKYDLSYEEWIMTSQDVMSRLYQKYKNRFTNNERKQLFSFGYDNKLRRK